MLQFIAIMYLASYTGALCAEAEIHREATLTRLGIEGDLSKLSESHYRTWNAEQDCEVNADEAFEQAVASAQLDRELTTEERAKFKERFVKEMLQDCKDDPEIATHWKNDVAQALENDKPAVTEALVKHINEGDSSWTAGTDPEQLSSAMLKKKCGYDASADPADHLDIASEEINLQSGPSSYNTADKIPQCKEVIVKVHNQGTCGSCWAFGALGALDGRLCLLSNGAFSGPAAQMSRSVAAACCPNRRDGCQGGFPEDVYKLLGSGGGVPLTGCVPYFGSGSGADHFNSKSRAPPCMRSCKTSGYPRSLSADTIKMPGMTGGRVGPWISGDSWQDSDAFGRKELYTNGPIPIAVLVDSRFQSYKSGIYKNGCKSKTANHVTTAYGYTPTMFQTTNSWGPGWGRGGYMDMGNCEIALWCVPKGTKFPAGYTLPGGNPSPSPPAPSPRRRRGPAPPRRRRGPAPPRRRRAPPAPPPPPPAPPIPDGGDLWWLDAEGVWDKGPRPAPGPSPPGPSPPGPSPPGPSPGPGFDDFIALDLGSSAKGCPSGTEITSYQECNKAIKARNTADGKPGYKEIDKDVTYSFRPTGCLTQCASSGTGYFCGKFNTHKPGMTSYTSEDTWVYCKARAAVASIASPPADTTEPDTKTEEQAQKEDEEAIAEAEGTV